MFFKKAKRFLAGVCVWSLLFTSIDQSALVVMAAENTVEPVENVETQTEPVSSGNPVAVSQSDNLEVYGVEADTEGVNADGADASGSDVSGSDTSGSDVSEPDSGESDNGDTIPDGFEWSSKGYYWNNETKTAMFAASREFIGDEQFMGNEEIEHIVFEDGAVLKRVGHDALEACPNLISVNLSNCSDLASIGYDAFMGCEKLEEVIFPDELNIIEKNAFKGCIALTTVTLTPGLTSIESSAFEGCSALSEVVIEANNMACNSSTSNIFKSCTISSIVFNNCTVVPAYLFKGATFAEDTTITIPATVQEIRTGAFASSNLEGIAFAPSSTLVTIGDSAFENCTLLGDVTFPASLKTIGNRAFYSCKSFVTLVIPDTVTALGNSAFAECKAVTSLTLSNAIKSASHGTAVFQNCIDLERVEIRSGLAEITKDEFNGCIKLAKVTIANSVLSIGNNAFKGCVSLPEITIPDSVTKLGTNVFENCTSLASVVMSKNVTVLSGSLFKNCEYLHEFKTSDNMDIEFGYIIIPENVTEIGASAFENCFIYGDLVSDLIISENVTSIGTKAFAGCTAVDYLTIESPEIKTCGSGIFSACILREVNWPNGITEIPSYLFNLAGFKGDAQIEIPNTVTKIGASAFAGSSAVPNNVAQITFEENSALVTIGNNAFQYCTVITSFTIPETVTSIGSNAFTGCSKLTEITIPEEVTSVGKAAFSDCSVLTTIHFNAKAVTSENENVFSNCNVYTITIGDKVQIIPAYFLKGAKFSTDANQEEVKITLDIPASVERIGKSAFYGIDNLKAVNFIGDSALMEIGESAFDGCTMLDSCDLPESVTVIGDAAFKNCSALTIMDLPVCLKTIGANAFNGCSGLEKVVMNTLITSIEEDAFTGCTNAWFYVVEGSYAEQWLIENGFEQRIVHINSITYVLDGGTNDERNIGGYEDGDVFTFYPAIKPGYTFEGWYLEDTFTTKIEGIDASNTGSLTLYAKYNYGVGGDEDYVQYDGYKFSESTGVMIIDASVISIAPEKFKNSDIKTKIKYVVFEVDSQVKSVGKSAFEGCTSLVEVDFTNCAELTEIDESAFSGCTTLKNIKFSEKLQTIGKYAFKGCTTLTTVTLPAKLMTIGESAFSGCSNLATVIVESGNLTCGNSIFVNCKISSIQFPNNNTVVPNNLFNKATFATGAQIVIPNHIQEIGESAFAGCTTLVNITFEDTEDKPSALSRISENAFSGCSKLAAVVFPANLKTISAKAFMGCNALTELDIPNTVIELGDSAFSGCKGITQVKLSNSTTTLGISIFENCTALTSVTIPTNITEITQREFYGCTSLASVVIAETVESIGASAFYNCAALTEITIPGSVATVGNSAFESCDLLNTVTVAEGVETLGNNVFADCKQITSVTIADSVTAIGDYAFKNCNLLINPILPKDLTKFSKGVFQGCSALEVISTSAREAQRGEAMVFPETITEIGESAFEGCVGIIDVTIPKNVTTIGAKAFKGCNAIGKVVIESLDITKCGKAIFVDCMLEEIVFPEGITTIPENLFSQAQFTTDVTVTIPATVTTIGAYAFAGILAEPVNASNIVFAEGSVLETIGNNAFQYCIAIEEFTIPDTTTFIGNYAFTDCQKLKGITIPENVTSLGTGAFSGCQVLTTVRFNAIAVTTAYVDIFKGCNIHTILIGDKVSILPDNLFKGANFATISGDSEAKLIELVIPASVVEIGEYALANIANIYKVTFAEGSMLTTVGAYAFNSCGELISCELPDTVTSIGTAAFGSCSKLAEMKLPSALLTLGSSAFKDCKAVTSYVVPKGVRVIEDNTFYGNAALETVTFEVAENETDIITKIGVNAFAECPKLTEIIIPEGVASIGATAFSGDTGLKKVRIPASVWSIGTDAFKDCSSAEFYVVADSYAETWLKANGFTTKIKYLNTITYELDGGVNDARNLSGYLDGEAFALYAAKKPGYEFKGWFLDAAFQTEVKNLSECTGNITLYANWGEKLQYTITYELNGGENHADNPATYTIDDTITLQKPTKYGYTFVNWFTDSTFVPSTVKTKIGPKAAEDITLYAKWTAKKVRVNFELNDKNATIDKKYMDVIFDDPYGELPVPTREGYLFDGWYTAEDAPIVAETIVSVAETHKLYARWVLDIKVEAPTSNYESGSELYKGTKIMLSTETPGADIYYSTSDGEDVSTASTRYNGPIELDHSMTIRAIGVKDGYKNSDVSEFVYKVIDESSYWGDVDEEDRDRFADASKVPEGIWVGGVEKEVVYTGKAIKFDLRVYDHKTLLTEKKDYTVKYSNNKVAAEANAGKAPTITITGKGNYKSKDKQVIRFSIKKRDIGGSEFEADDMWAAVTGNVQKPVPVITWGKTKLKNKRDFVVDPSAAFSAKGVYTVEVTGNGNYTGTRTIQFELTDAKLMSKAKISGLTAMLYNNGEEVTPKPVVKYNGVTLTEDTHYTLSYRNHREPGTATVIVTGKGEYAGIKKATFKISPKGDMKKAKVEFRLNGATVKSVPYTGSAIELNVGEKPLTAVVSCQGNTLKEGEHYVIDSYSKNTNVGTASVVLRGINGYSGTFKKTFKIVAADITGWDVKFLDADGKVIDGGASFGYCKGGCKPAVYLEYNGQKLKAGTDYTLSYTKNKAIGTATVTVKGKKNFKGKTSDTFGIQKQNIGNLNILLQDVAYENKAGIYEVKPVITDVDGKKLVAGKDYSKDITYVYAYDVTVKNNNKDIVRKADESVNPDDIIPKDATIKVTVKGSGNYIEEIVGYYSFVGKSIAKAKVVIEPQEYTGKEVQPGKDQITVYVDGELVKEEGDSDYDIIGYDKNVSRGTATVTLRGKGIYGGTVTAKFKIVQQNFIISFFEELKMKMELQ